FLSASRPERAMGFEPTTSSLGSGQSHTRRNARRSLQHHILLGTVPFASLRKPSRGFAWIRRISRVNVVVGGSPGFGLMCVPCACLTLRPSADVRAGQMPRRLASHSEKLLASGPY